MKIKKNNRGKPVDKSGIDPNVLNNWVQQDKARWDAVKCQALIALSKGVSVTDVCKVLGVTRESVRLWRICLKQKGLKGLVAPTKKGKVSKLTDHLKNDLRKVIYMDPRELGYSQNEHWTGKLLCKYLKEKWGVHIAVRTAQNWIKQIKNL
ncbi:hypothetical protein GF340_04180 [Candidatus Peregrinibacteria bacterium]|nr:hypothetical protein [Candidatus Peregrinibacteria bacterium]